MQLNQEAQMLPTMDLHKELRNGGTEEFISQDRAGGLKQENFSSLTIFFYPKHKAELLGKL